MSLCAGSLGLHGLCVVQQLNGYVVNSCRVCIVYVEFTAIRWRDLCVCGLRVAYAEWLCLMCLRISLYWWVSV